MTDRDLLKMALEALEWEWGGEPLGTLTWNAITALRERLAQPEFDSALQSAAMTQTAPKLAQPEQEPKHDYRTRYDRGCYKCGSHYCPADCPEPEHSPLDRMAENARELGLDYEPVREPPQFPTMLRKMWSGGEVQKWINENWSKHGNR